MSSQAPSAETLTSTAKAYLKVFDTLDPAVITNIQAPNYKHQNGPSSLSPPEPFTVESFAAHLKFLRTVLKGFPVFIKEIWPNPHLRQVVIWTTSETHFHDHVKDSDDGEEWKIRGEYIWVLGMDESGEKIEGVFEFLDSKVTEELKLLCARAFAKAKKDGLNTGKSDGKGGWNLSGE